MNAAGMLLLLRAEPTLMPPAPTTDLGSAINRRREDEVHACLSCGGRAGHAFIAHTNAGPRWLDLCWPCSAAVRRANA